MTLVEQLGSLSRALQRRIGRQLAAVTDVPFQQVRALRAIQREGIVSQVSLADRLLIDAPAASRLVDRLVEDGFLKREPGDDRRCVKLRLTPKAKAPIAALDRLVDQADAELRGFVTKKDADALGASLRKLAEGLAAEP